MLKVSKILSLALFSTLFAAAVSAQCGPGGCNVRRAGPSQYGNQGYYQQGGYYQQQPNYQNFQGNYGNQGYYQQQQPYYQGRYQQSYSNQPDQRFFAESNQDFGNAGNYEAGSFRSDYSEGRDLNDRGPFDRDDNNPSFRNESSYNQSYNQGYQNGYNNSSNPSTAKPGSGKADATVTTIHPNGKTTTESINSANSQNRY